MPDDARLLARRGRRIAGLFLLMIGAGVLLDSEAVWAGALLFAGGLGLWAGSFMAQPSPDVLAERAREEP